MNALKVVLISQNASPGLIIFRKEFIEFLVSLGCSVYCFALDYTPLSRRAIEEMGAIPIDYKLSKAGLNPVRDALDVFSLYRKIKSIKPDVVFSFFVKPSIYGTLAAGLAGVPRRIAMLEGLGYIHTRSRQGFCFKKIILRYVHGFLCSVSYLFADRVLFLNESDLDDLCNFSYISRKKLQVFGPIGLDLFQYPYVPVNLRKPVRFIFIARLLVEKGVFEYLDAARIVRRLFPGIEFVILGALDKDNPAALSSAQLKLVVDEGLVIYPGHVADVPAWISDSHVFVLPSYREGFPRSTQEAMAIGRAVLTTDVPGCRETVENGVNGFVVPPFNAEKLAEKMIYLINNPDIIRRMGDESRRIAVEMFDASKINSKLAAIVTNIDS